MCEGLLYAYRAGLDPTQVIAAVGAGAAGRVVLKLGRAVSMVPLAVTPVSIAGSWSINNLGPRIVNRNFEPGFFVEHFIKGQSICS